jgi:hypothetical protein
MRETSEEPNPESLEPEDAGFPEGTELVHHVSNSAARRRARRLAPGAIFLSVLVVLGAFIFVVMPLPAFGASTISGDGPQVCEHCPDGESGCIPNCGPPPPPCSPQYVDISIIDVSVTSSSTNGTMAAISWQESPDFSTTDTFLDWGNTTSEAFTQPAPYTGSTVTLTLNFLEPGTKYYFTIVANPASASCTVVYEPGSYSSSFTTVSDSSLTVSGTVSAVINGQTESPPAGTMVIIHCTGWEPTDVETYDLGVAGEGDPNTWFNYTLTNSNGGYSFDVAMDSQIYGESGSICGIYGRYYAVQTENVPVFYVGGTEYASQATWTGVWNESIVTWAPQVVNVGLPNTYVSGFLPMTYDFTNSSYTLFTVSSDSTMTTSESYALSVQGAISGVSVGGGTSYSTDAFVETQSVTPGVTGDSFVIQQEYEVTGTMVFNAISGRSITLFPDFYEPSGTIGSGPTSVSDWMSRPACNSDPGVVICRDFEGSQPFSATMTSGGSLTLGSSFDVAVSEGIDIPGLGTGITTVTDSYTTTFTSATSYSVEISVAPPSGVCYGFEYEFQGDSSESDGVVAHVWNIGDQPQSDC